MTPQTRGIQVERITRLALQFALIAMVLGMTTSSAHAWLKVCNNNSSNTLWYSHNYWSTSCPNCSPPGRWKDKGWWQVNPGSCKTVYGSSAKRTFYYTAVSSTGGVWTGPWEWYVSNNEHDRCWALSGCVGLSCSGETCVPNPVWRGHREIKPSSTNFTINFQ